MYSTSPETNAADLSVNLRTVMMRNETDGQSPDFHNSNSLPLDSDEGSFQSDDDSQCSSILTPFAVAPSVKHRDLHYLCADHASVPSRNHIAACGEILVRTNPCGLLRRKAFASRFWVRYGRHLLLFFDSKETFAQWLFSEDLSADERKNLVIDRIDFEKDSLSHDILGYKPSHPYVKQCRNREMLVFKLYQWRSRGTVSMGAISPFLAKVFASQNADDLDKLFRTVINMIRGVSVNVHLQHKIIASDAFSTSIAHKIGQFNALEYQHEFSDWLLQTKLEESGFIVSSRSSVHMTNQNALESIRRTRTGTHSKCTIGQRL